MNERPLQRALRQALRLLREAGLRGAFGGGLAVIVWGRPRVTQDLDLFVDLPPAAVDRFLRAARQGGFDYDAEDAETLIEGGFIRLVARDAGAGSMPLDILVADTELHREALDRAQTFAFEDEQVPVLTAEDLILLKLVAFRPKDTFDLETVIDAVGTKLDRAYLQRWAQRLQLEARLATFLRSPASGD